MTDLAGALADTSKLNSFEGRDVLKTTVAVTNAGDGLSQAMRIEPIELHHGEKVYLVLECNVDKIRYEPIGDTDALTRVHVLKAGNAAMVDEELVSDVLEQQRIKIQRAKDAARGQGRLPTDEELYEAHNNGEHDMGLVPGCADCDLELDQQADEAQEAAKPTDIGSRRKKAAPGGS